MKKINPEFPLWMDKMIRKSGYSRSQVVHRASLEQSYGYKILKGTRHTGERDYILSLCISARMNAEEIQHALMLYEMEQLKEDAQRDRVILHGIAHGCTVDQINDLLEENGLPYLKSSSF